MKGITIAGKLGHKIVDGSKNHSKRETT